MEPNNLLTDPVFGLESPTGFDRTDLPGLLAALGEDRALSMPRLQRHQEEAFHIFLSYLGAAVLVRSNESEPAQDATFWRHGLRNLADEEGDHEGNSWRLTVDDACLPGFMQPPVPQRVDFRRFKPKAETPDELDRLITAKNHDVKSKRCASAEVEDWVYALVSLQTMSGYGGRGYGKGGYYGIARMNSGAGSRPVVALVPDGTWSERWRVDVRRLMGLREGLLQGSWGYQPRGLVLTWVPAWDLETNLPLRSLDPYFIEIARAVRLVRNEGRLVAYSAGTQVPRLGAKAALGNLGDPWIPVEIEGKNGPQALTVAGGFSARLLRNLIFFEDGGYHPAPMQLPASELAGVPVKFVASVLIGGQSTTDGFHHVEIPIPDRVRTILFDPGPARDSLALRSRQALEAAGRFELQVLKPAAFSFLEASGGDRDINWKDPAMRTWWQRISRSFTTSWSVELFPWLWVTAEATNDDEAIAVWLCELRRCGQDTLDMVMREYPRRQGRHFRSRAVAEGIFIGSLLRHFPELKEALVVSQQTEEGISTRTLAQTTALVARVVSAEDFPTGERARLKRWSPGEPPSLALFRFAFRHLPEGWEQKSEAWTTLTTGIAIMCPEPHRPDVSLGRALADTGYAEARLERLLAAEGNTLQTLLLRSARFLRAKNVGCNCADFARLLGLGGDIQEARMRIARDYYRQLVRPEIVVPRG